MTLSRLSAAVLALACLSCGTKSDPNRIVIWHQMRVDERLVLEEQMKEFMNVSLIENRDCTRSDNLLSLSSVTLSNTMSVGLTRLQLT